MQVEFRTCEFEMDFEAYMKFLLRHYTGLNLPYPFAMSLTMMSSPLLFGKAMLMISEDCYEVVGAAAFAYGTGAKEHEDRHICQVEIAFIQEPFRRTPLFIRGLQKLVGVMKAGNPDVTYIQFWASAGDDNVRKLVSRWSSVPGFKQAVVDDLAFYKIPFAEVEAYCSRYEAS